MFSQQPEPIVTLLNGSIGPLSVETGESWCGKAIEEFQSRAANMECHKLGKHTRHFRPSTMYLHFLSKDNQQDKPEE